MRQERAATAESMSLNREPYREVSLRQEAEQHTPSGPREDNIVGYQHRYDAHLVVEGKTMLLDYFGQYPAKTRRTAQPKSTTYRLLS